MGKIKKFLLNPYARFGYLSHLGLLNWMDDEKYLRKEHYLIFGEKLNLDNPETFNEKMQWLKLHDRNNTYVKMADKIEAKRYVANIIGNKYIIPTLGVYNRFNDIIFDELPNQFVIKCTHDSGGIIICKDKSSFDVKSAKKKIKKLLKRNFYYAHREWPYKNIKPRIIIEKYMGGKDDVAIKDYKFFCFNGEPNIVLVCTDRFSESGVKETWYDSAWNLLPVTEGGHDTDPNLKCPKRFEEMKKLSKRLSENMPFLRVDFYEIDGRVYFGELTFYPAAGYERFKPESWNKKLGDLIDLGLLEK